MNATISKQAKSELASVIPNSRGDALAELSAIVHTAGTLRLKRGGVEAFLYFFFRYLQKFGQRYGGQRVGYIVKAGHLQGVGADFLVVPDAVEGGKSQFIISDIGRCVLGLRIL